MKKYATEQPSQALRTATLAFLKSLVSDFSHGDRDVVFEFHCCVCVVGAGRQVGESDGQPDLRAGHDRR